MSVERIMLKLGVDQEAAEELLDTAEAYRNKGKGLVFVDYKAADKVAKLFDARPIWLSAELNEAVGWQFSQAIFQLRRWGWKIDTVSVGRRMFAYKLIAKPE